MGASKLFPILFFTALSFESKVILINHKNKQIWQENNLRFYQLDRTGYLMEVGLGVKADPVTILNFLKDISPAVALNFGICGALNTSLAIGASFAISKVCTARLRANLKALVLGFSTNSLYTSAKPVLSAKERDGLFQKTSCDLVDMEAAILYRLCKKSNITFQCLKVVSDFSDENTTKRLKTNRATIKADLKNAYDRLLNFAAV
jgi:nucleoside phosphorylase